MTSRHEGQPQNHLLATLSAAEMSGLRPQLKLMALEPGEVLQDPGERINYVHFPLSGMISLLAVMSDGKAVETAALGREGALGAHCGFGPMHAHVRAVVEISGSSLRIPATQFQKFVRESEKLRELIIRYRELRLAQTQQSVACNALHGAEAQLSRWLLHISDIIGSDTVPLTQEFLSQTLGVRRTTVTALARILQRAGIIHYVRGRIEISDREQLKNISCECYDVLQRLSPQILRQKR